MSTLTSYNGINVVSPEPTALGGKAINDNFMALSTPLNTADPVASDDNTQGFSEGSRWFNITTQTEFICTDATATNAVWEVVAAPSPWTAYALLHSTDFGGYANTGVTAPGGILVDGWIDVNGGYSIASGVAVTNGGLLLRPATENSQQGFIQADFSAVTSGAGQAGLAVRGNSTTNSGYIAFFYEGALYVRALVSGSATDLPFTHSSGPIIGPGIIGAVVSMSLEARSTGSGSTDLIIKLWNTSNADLVSEWTVTGDSTTSLQSLGQSGVYIFAGDSTSGVKDVRTYNALSDDSFVGNIFTSGKVGIGITSPVTALDVIGDSSSNTFIAKPQSTAPSSPVAGQIYYNNSDDHFYGWNGSAWKQLDN